MDEAGSIASILTEVGPCLSSTLAEELVRRHNISAQAARKRIERAIRSADIQTLPAIRFKHNEQVLFEPTQRQQRDFAKRLLAILQKSNSSYKFPLAGVMARGGAVPDFLFRAVSAFPISKRSDSDLQTADEVLSKLLTAGLLERQGQFIRLAVDFFPRTISESRLAARLKAETLFLSVLKDFLHFQGLGSKGKCKVRADSQMPQFGFFEWDLVAPSFVRPLASAGLPGFIVCDVILGRQLNISDITYFVRKTRHIRSFKNNRPFMALLIADWFDRDALQLGRKHGLVLTTPRNLFGNDLSGLIDDLTQALEQKEQFFQMRPQYLTDCVRRLTHIAHWKSAYLSIRQVLFSLISSTALTRAFSLKSNLKSLSSPLAEDPSIEFILQTTDGGSALVSCKDQVAHRVTVDELASWILNVQLHNEQTGKYVFCTSGHFAPSVTEWFASTQLQNIRIFDYDSIYSMLLQEDPVLAEQFELTFDREQVSDEGDEWQDLQTFANHAFAAEPIEENATIEDGER